MATKTNPYVTARSDEPLYSVSIVTRRDDRKAGYIGWRIHWDGDQHSAPDDGDAPAVYYLVETCSQQYSEEYGEPTYGAQVWRVENGEVTHDAWFAWASADPAKAVKNLCDVYPAIPICATLRTCYHDGGPLRRWNVTPIDPDSLRVVRSINSSYCYLVY